MSVEDRCAAVLMRARCGALLGAIRLGPVLSVIPIDDEAEALCMTNGTLSASGLGIFALPS